MLEKLVAVAITLGLSGGFLGYLIEILWNGIGFMPGITMIEAVSMLTIAACFVVYLRLVNAAITVMTQR
jgi:hypothetical protein